MKADSVKQEFEKQDELKRCALRAVNALLAIPDADKSPIMGEFLAQVSFLKAPKLQFEQIFQIFVVVVKLMCITSITPRGAF